MQTPCSGRDTQARDVLNAIHLASRGLQVLPRRSTDESRLSATASLLTPRESEVLPLLREGRSNAQIALALSMGVETVRTHARSIYRKLGVSSRRELSASLLGPGAHRFPLRLVPRRDSAGRPARLAFPGGAVVSSHR